MSGKRSALDALSAAEKAAVLDELLAARPDLRQPAEAYAAQVMTGADRSAVASDVEDALQGLGIEELNTRAGYRAGTAGSAATTSRKDSRMSSGTERCPYSAAADSRKASSQAERTSAS